MNLGISGQPPVEIVRLHEKKPLWPVWVAIVFPSIATYLYFVAFSGRREMQLLYTGSKFVQFVFPLAWMLFVERTRINLRRPGRQGLAFGIGFGALVLAATISVYHLALASNPAFANAPVALAEKLQGMGIHGIREYVLLATFISVAHSLLEEYYWRWFVYGRLRANMTFGPAITISSLGFMAHHVIVLACYISSVPLVVLFSLGVALGGAVWAWLYERTGSILSPWLSHLIVDVGLMIVGYDFLQRIP